MQQCESESLCHQGVSGEQHHMLPAGQAADAAVRALVNTESDSITFAPYRALGMVGLSLRWRPRISPSRLINRMVQ